MTSLPLLTIAETCAFLNIRPGSQDARVRTLIAMTTASLELATERTFTRQTITEYLTTRDNQKTDYDFAGSIDYVTPTIDFGGMRTIVTPQSLSLSGLNIDPASVRVWYVPHPRAESDYNDAARLGARLWQLDVKDNDTCALVVNAGTRFMRRAIKVAYEAGYEAASTTGSPEEMTLSASIPEWLRAAALVQAQFLNLKLRADNIGMAAERSVSDKGKVVSSPFLAVNGITPEAMSFVAHIRRTRMGRG